ncbi:MAG: hypothetical protein ACRDPA_24090 [Solirubrobacteraceae bacterium]
MTLPTVTELVRNPTRVGKRVELARYTIPTGEHALYGQRVNGVVRFLPWDRVVLDGARADSNNDICRCRGRWATGGGAHAVRQKRPHGEVSLPNVGEAS